MHKIDHDVAVAQTVDQIEVQERHFSRILHPAHLVVDRAQVAVKQKDNRAVRFQSALQPLLVFAGSDDGRIA